MKHRHALPQLHGYQMITEGGLETSLVFHSGIDLPLFAAFIALETDAGIRAIDAWMRAFAELAGAERRCFIMDTPSWRASDRWAAELGIGQDDLREIHREAVATLSKLRDAYETPASPFVISGTVGPQDDGYAPSTTLTAAQAATYPRTQEDWLAEFGADMVSASSITYAEEAAGIAAAAKAAGVPVVISFTLETDGHLPSGEALADAIAAVDAATGGYPSYYMINCAHPDHFAHILDDGAWSARIMGLRANASRCSHAELDAAETLDDGNPAELGVLCADLRRKLPNLTVIGGCCGTDQRHVSQMCRATRAA